MQPLRIGICAKARKIFGEPALNAFEKHGCKSIPFDPFMAKIRLVVLESGLKSIFAGLGLGLGL